MPLHLFPAARPLPAEISPEPDEPAPGISRRTFLARTAAASAALALGSTCRAETGGEPWYALVSDIHIAADPAKQARGQTMADNLRATVADLRSLGDPPLGMFIDGDLALANGQKDDYRTVVSLLEPVRSAKVPIHLGLGNHDDRANFRDVLHDLIPPSQTEVVDKQIGIVEGPGIRFFILDSLDKVNVTPGKLGRAQLDWLASRLDANRDAPALVLVHHNLGPNAPTGLTDTQELLEVVAPRKHVKGVVFGHTHVWDVRQVDDLYLINLPAVAYPFSSIQPLGWCRFVPKPGGGELELRCVGGNRRADRQKVALRWRGD